jgi:hypothetical protein
MGDRFQVLSESVLTGREGETHFEQERIWGAWTWSEALYTKLGLEHSPISRWNRLYHHGSWLEPTIDRPLLASFEGDADGFLPLHNSGLELGGRAHPGVGLLDYFLIVSNGRGINPTDKQRVSDRNDAKAVIVGAGFAPEGAPDLRLGVALERDDVPADSGSPNPSLQRTTHETIGSAWIESALGPLRATSEVALMDDDNEGRSFEHRAGYLQITWPLGDWTPYARFDTKRMELGDPFLAQNNRDLDKWQQILGVRYDITSKSALKLELGYGEREERDSSGNVDERDFWTAAIQLAWSI